MGIYPSVNWEFASSMIYLLKMVILRSYVKLPGG